MCLYLNNTEVLVAKIFLLKLISLSNTVAESLLDRCCIDLNIFLINFENFKLEIIQKQKSKQVTLCVYIFQLESNIHVYSMHSIIT